MPDFLTLEDMLELHTGQIRAYGGSHGLRSSDLLQSAIAQPEATFGGQFLHTDIFLMAAAYLFHLVLGVAEGQIDKAQIAEFFRNHAVVP